MMKSLISFIDEGAEEKKEEKYRILVVSSASSTKGETPIYHTASRFRDKLRNKEEEISPDLIEDPFLSALIGLRYAT